jgi:lipoic acid synthetase
MNGRPLPVVDSSTHAAAMPAWLATPAPTAARTDDVRAALRGLGTVCEAARCPNLATCWASGTATVMVMGPVCTRGCRFCHVPHGRPTALDPDEPAHLARFVRARALRHVVITSVDRDDLDDHGAGHLAACITAVVRTGAAVEALIPDLGGDRSRIARVVDAGVAVVAHNLETVARLSPGLRDRRASYARSLSVLRAAKQGRDDVLTKSSLILGLGEGDDEILDALIDLRAADVDIVTLGQYLRPSERQTPVVSWVAPSRFDDLAEDARSLGFAAVASGPLVRSSYRAADLAHAARAHRARLSSLVGDRS